MQVLGIHLGVSVLASTEKIIFHNALWENIYYFTETNNRKPPIHSDNYMRGIHVNEFEMDLLEKNAAVDRQQEHHLQRDRK